MHTRRFILALLSAASLSTAAEAAPLYLYDAAAGTLPQSQATMTYIGLGAAPVLVADGTELDTSTAVGGLAGFFNHELVAPPKSWALKNPAFPSLDPASGFTLAFFLTLADESHANGQRAGFSLIVIGADQRGIELGFWLDRIWAQSGPDFLQAEGAGYDTTSRSLYALSILGTSYTLHAQGIPILSGPTRDYTPANPFVDPYEQPGMVFLGDDTSSARARFTLGSVWLELRDVPEPGSLALLLGGWLAVALLGARLKRPAFVRSRSRLRSGARR